MTKWGILVLFHAFAAAKQGNVRSTNTPQNAETNMIPSTGFTFLDFLDELVDDNNVLSNNQIDSKNHTEDCLAIMVESYSMNKSDTNDTEWFCEDKNHLLYKIKGLGPDVLNDKKMISGVSHIISSNATKKVDLKSPEDDEIFLDAESVDIEINENDVAERNLEKIGDRTLLVLRVISLDGEPTLSADKMSEMVFSSYEGSFAFQVASCSKEKLKYIPASGIDDIVDGTLEIAIAYNLTGMNSHTASNLVQEAAQEKYGSFPWNYDHILAVVQPDVEQFTAWAYVNGWWSFYSDQYYQMPMVIFHELGHNLGLLHSNEDDEEYGDSTGIMGGTGSIFRCFNGAKSWFLNWYSDRQVLIEPTESSVWLGKMVGVNDYSNGETSTDHNVVAKVTTMNDTDLYIMYNQKEGINSATIEYGDFVTVVQAINDDISHRSNLLAVLSGGEAIDYDETVIRVCGITDGTPDYATVMVYLKSDDDSEVVKDKCNSSCGGCKSDPVTFSTCEADKNSICETYANLGYCTAQKVEFMEENCKTSCGICSEGVTKFISPLDCKDTQSQDYCEYFYSYCSQLKNTCKKTCGFCSVESTTNIPTKTPVELPTNTPVEVPTRIPTKTPVEVHTKMPTKIPVDVPTKMPSKLPVVVLTRAPSDPPTKMPETLCKDNISEITCNTYKQFNYCTYASVKEYCPKTCGVCGSVELSTNTPSDVPTKMPTTCKDIYPESSCTVYKKYNYCSYESVKPVCTKTCDLCDACFDIWPESTCTGYEKYGYCKNNESVNENCPKTCGICELDG